MMNIEAQFSEAIQSAGMVPPASIHADGKLHRFSSSGKSRDTAGYYVLHDDGIPSGMFGCFRSDIKENWRADLGRSLTPAEVEAHKTNMEAMRRIHEAEVKADRERKAELARRLWVEAMPLMDHPYIERKGIKTFGSAKVQQAGYLKGEDDRPLTSLSGLCMMLPVKCEGMIIALQAIQSDGERRFIGSPKGGSLVIGQLSKNTPRVLICEGFATACSVHEATGMPTVCAFSAGNLLEVAQRLHKALPGAELVLAADRDTHGKGEEKAIEAAQAVGGLIALPDFSNTPESEAKARASDFNDLHQLAGVEEVARQVATAKRLEAAVDDWPDPMPIPSTLLPVAPFDFDLLPESLRPWIHDIAERMQCPPDFPAVGAMVALSSVIGRKACIQPKRQDDWKVTPNLWGCIVGRPGFMKSPALSEALRPLDHLEKQAADLHAELVRDYEVAQKLNAMTEKATDDKATKLVKEGKRQEAEMLLRDAADSEERPPALRRYRVTDATVEVLGEILIDNPWGTLAYRDELVGLLKGLDKPGQEGARAFYLQGYDGNQSYAFDRIGRGKNLHIPAVCLSLLGGIQPGRLQGYIREAVTGGTGDDGLIQRFGLLVWPDAAAEWLNVDRWPNTPARQTVHELFIRMDAMPPSKDADTGEEVPALYRFTPDAQALFDQWRSEFEPTIRSGDYHPALESHLSKYRKLVPALALVCSLADAETDVSFQSLARALAWVQYLQSHAERTYAAGTRPDTEAASALLKAIRSGKIEGDTFTARDVYRRGLAHLATAEAVTEAARMLADLDHLRLVEQAASMAGGRPTTVYCINPKTRRG